MLEIGSFHLLDLKIIRNSKVVNLLERQIVFLFLPVYPTLDLSDNEDGHVFKPRGRMKKDETWNPKGDYITYIDI